MVDREGEEARLAGGKDWLENGWEGRVRGNGDWWWIGRCDAVVWSGD